MQKRRILRKGIRTPQVGSSAERMEPRVKKGLLRRLGVILPLPRSVRLKDRKLDELEKRFIAQSGSAFRAAWRQARASGQTVVISDQGGIYEVAPTGERRLLKQIEPPTPVKRGAKFMIR